MPKRRANRAEVYGAGHRLPLHLSVSGGDDDDGRRTKTVRSFLAHILAYFSSFSPSLSHVPRTVIASECTAAGIAHLYYRERLSCRLLRLLIRI